MIKQCKQCQVQYEITQEDLAFYDKISPEFNWKKYQIPAPTLCPNCRTQLRFSFRNFFKLYHRKSDLTGKQMISMYDKDASFPVYELHEWWSDDWDPLEYWKEIDFSKSIFDQIMVLHKTVPRMNIMNSRCENTDYCNLSATSKNCYLVFWNVWNEDCCYGHIVWQSKNCFDCLYVYKSEYCYQCIDWVECYNICFSVNTDNCSDSKFLINCANCKDCFWCVWLRAKQYMIFNEQYSKEDYELKLSEFNSWNYKIIEFAQKKVNSLISKEIVKYYHWFNCENITWDYLYNCKNSINCFDLKNCENVKNCATLDKFIDCHDCNFSQPWTELSYNSITINWYNLLFCHTCINNCNYLIYCDNCSSCESCFWCFALKNKKYCIFNKQYSKQEYDMLAPKIIEFMQSIWEWWEFFSANISSFWYNETIAYEYYPLSKQEVLQKWWKWKDEEDNAKNYF